MALSATAQESSSILIRSALRVMMRSRERKARRIDSVPGDSLCTYAGEYARLTMVLSVDHSNDPPSFPARHLLVSSPLWHPVSDIVFLGPLRRPARCNATRVATRNRVACEQQSCTVFGGLHRCGYDFLLDCCHKRKPHRFDRLPQTPSGRDGARRLGGARQHSQPEPTLRNHLGCAIAQQRCGCDCADAMATDEPRI